MVNILIFIILVAIDQLTKYFAFDRLREIVTVGVIDGFFSLTYVENRGAAFGMLQGGKWIFLAITVVVLVFIVVYYARHKKTRENLWLRVALTMIASGAVGNAIDRIVRGFVVDFFDFNIFGYDFPVFNFADILVVIGTILLAGGIIFLDDKRDKGEEK